MNKPYKRHFKEEKLEEDFYVDIMRLFQNNIDGYGGPGIEHLAEYNRIIFLTIKHITNDAVEVLDSISNPIIDPVVDEYSEKDKLRLRNIVSELKKLRI